jgi:hypothetical protein
MTSLVDPTIINSMRALAKSGATVAALVECLCSALKIEVNDSSSNFYTLLYFKKAFSIPPEVLFQIPAWEKFQGDYCPYTEEDLQRLVLPAIMQAKDKWDSDQ